MEDFKAKDAGSYDTVARSFARFTDTVTRSLAESTVRFARLTPNARVLDVGTGSGIVALEAARAAAQGRVVGLDLSEGLLEVAREKANAMGGGRISLVRADAEMVPFAEASFDRVVSLYALLHFPHPDRAMAEMVRVLKPGGWLVIGIGSKPPLSSMNGWVNRLGRLSDPVRLATGRLRVAPAHLDAIVERHIPEMLDPEETGLAQLGGARAAKASVLMSQCGLKDVGSNWQGRHLVLGSADEFWELQSTFSSMARKRLQSATPAQLQAVRREFDEDCRQVLSRRGQLVYHYGAYFLYGQRPLAERSAA